MRDHAKRHFRDSGFTLTELLAVIAVMAILSIIAVPAFSRWMPQYRLKQASRDLYSAMQLMKMTAVKNNQTANIIFSTSPHQYQFGISGVTKTVTLNDYGSGVKFQDYSHTATFGTSPLTFDGRGFPNSAFLAYLSNEGNTDYYCVSLATSGAISLLKHNGTAYN